MTEKELEAALAAAKAAKSNGFTLNNIKLSGDYDLNIDTGGNVVETVVERTAPSKSTPGNTTAYLKIGQKHSAKAVQQLVSFHDKNPSLGILQDGAEFKDTPEGRILVNGILNRKWSCMWTKGKPELLLAS